jgi:hypothetical protein
MCSKDQLANQYGNKELKTYSVYIPCVIIKHYNIQRPLLALIPTLVTGHPLTIASSHITIATAPTIPGAAKIANKTNVEFGVSFIALN